MENKKAVHPHDYNARRAFVLAMAREGRAQLLPAGARDNTVARVLIDGEDFGAASTVCHFVREGVSTTAYGLRNLIPGYDHQIPNSLR